MRDIRLYANQGLALNQQIHLAEDSQRHVTKVLRLRIGDEIVLFNGDGQEYRAKIVVSDKKNVVAEIIAQQVVNRESNLSLTLCLALLKGDAMDFAVQKAVELGVKRIVPFSSKRTERHLKGERAEKKQQHWQKIMISASQQCGRTYLPEMLLPATFDDALEQPGEQRLILSPHHQDEHAHIASPKNITLMVGPEGGFESEEVAQALSRGWQTYQLGPRVLRADTAVVSALAVLQAQYGDLR